MKKINLIKLGMAFVVALAIVGCEKSPVKSDYDYLPNAKKLPVLKDFAFAKIAPYSVELAYADTSINEGSLVEKGFLLSDDSLELLKDTVLKSAMVQKIFIAKDPKKAPFVGKFSEGIEPATKYFVRAYVQTMDGIAYTRIQGFTTLRMLKLYESNGSDCTFIDKDGDGKNWVFDTENQLYFSFAYDFDAQAPLKPENYMLFPGIDYTEGKLVELKATFGLAILHNKYHIDEYQVLIAENPMTAENIATAKVLTEGSMKDVADEVEVEVTIPAEYEGKTFYLALAHIHTKDDISVGVAFLEMKVDGPPK